MIKNRMNNRLFFCSRSPWLHCFLFSALLFSGLLFCGSALAVDKALDSKQEVRNQYEPIIERINQQLPNNLIAYKKNLGLLSGFIDQNVRIHWDASSTTSALVGKEAFQTLTPKQEKTLVSVVDQTLLRYAIEGFEYYNGHQFKLTDIAISNSGNMGWIKVLMEASMIPDLNLEVLIKRNKQGIWKAVDVRFMGITYVAIKKYFYRRTINKQGVDGLIDQLKAKNDKFFYEICTSVPKQDSYAC